MSTDLRKLKRKLMRDKRKLAMLVTLAAFGLLLWGRLLLKQTPRTATAEPGASLAVSTGEDGGYANGDDGRYVGRDVVVVAMQDRVRRDLFAFDPSFYPKIAVEEEAGIDDVPAKSSVNQTDESEREAQKEAAVLAAARNLELQSTMMGANSRALINGTLLKAGEQIKGFTVKAVRNREAILEKDGVEIRLEM
jgi:hypothetical protein